MTELRQYRDPHLMTNNDTAPNDIKVIGFYEREFYPFSNFSSFMVNWRGYDWMTSEHAYHSEKFHGIAPELVEALKGMRSAHDAFKFAKLHKAERRADWNDIKHETMKEICRAKLKQHAYIQQKLLETNDATLVEDSLVDEYWGWGPNRDGANHLGTIWMELREELRNGEIK